MAVNMFGELPSIYIFIIIFYFPEDGKLTPGQDWHYFIRTEKITSSKIAKEPSEINGHHQSSVYGGFFFWRSPTWQLILDTCTRLLFHLSAAVNPQCPPPHLQNTIVCCTCVYYYKDLASVRRPAELYISLSVSQLTAVSLLVVTNRTTDMSYQWVYNIIINNLISVYNMYNP